MPTTSSRGVSRRTVFVGLVALSASGLPTSAQAKKQRFGAAIPNKQRRYYQRMAGGMSETAEKLGIELQIQEYANDVKTELDVVNAFVQQGLDGYIVVSSGVEGVETEIARTVQKISAPLAAVDHRIPGAAVTVLPDWQSAGTLQAELAMSLAPANSVVLYLTVQTEFGAASSEAFQIAIKQRNSTALVVTINSFSRDNAIAQTLTALSSNPHIAVIAASTDQLALWAVEAAAKAGQPVKVIGLGASEEGLAGIANRSLSGTIDLRPDAQGSAAVSGLAPVAGDKHLCDNGQKPPCPEQLIQPQTITSKDGPKG
jgi:ABC-type sugar transport system substrate-binding protein